MTVRTRSISPCRKFMIAGLGGIMPVVVSLIIVDLQTLLLNVTPLSVASYLIRALALFAIGGLAGWLHRNESDPVKLFQLGIAAPALITAAVNGGRVSLPETAVDRSLGSSWPLVTRSYAQPSREPGLRQFSLPVETPRQQIYRGFLGTIPSNVWYVIAGSHPDREAAERQAGEIRRAGFPADVYAPYGGDSHYAVVIGAQLTLTEAREIQRKALASGLPRGTYLWTFPQR